MGGAPRMSPYRARLYRLVFAAAAVYNIAFGLWAATRPLSFFTLFDLGPPQYPSVWACLGMVIGLYGLGYAYAARNLARAPPFIAIGLVGKLIGPIGWIVTVTRDAWPVRTFTLMLFNDVIWWLPFTLFLLEGTRVAESVRRAAPYACAALNLLAIVAMATLLRRGTELVPEVAARVGYISQNLAASRALARRVEPVDRGGTQPARVLRLVGKLPSSRDGDSRP